MTWGRGRSWWVSALLAVGCSADPGTGDDTSGDDTGAAEGSTTSTSTSTVGEATTVSATGTSFTTTSAEESSSGEPPGPLGAPCSVQEVTEGALYDPLERGDGVGVFPPPVADVLEDYCGCHVLSGGAQNLGWPKLQAPGGTNFTTYADLGNPYGGTTLGMAMMAEVGAGMPPGSCSFFTEPRELLLDWFAQGMPDGATYVPP